ncbi:MAG: DUF1684 domain-containing protein [Trueperaceae bacterium]
MDDRSESSNFTDLLDYRRQVGELYGEVRRGGTGATASHERFRQRRNELFASHPQSPLNRAQRGEFAGLSYFPYDPGLRFCLPVDTDVTAEAFEVRLQDDGPVMLERVAKVRFSLQGQPAELSLFWLGGYGGGLFLPFRDASNGTETYGGGRYLLDTIKGVDLGAEAGRLIIDFNYAYNPSCAYDSRWDCPLPPAENWLHRPVRAGEMGYAHR